LFIQPVDPDLSGYMTRKPVLSYTCAAKWHLRGKMAPVAVNWHLRGKMAPAAAKWHPAAAKWHLLR